MMSSPSDSDLYTFSVSLDVKEDDGKGNFRYPDHSHTFEHVVMIKKADYCIFCNGNKNVSKLR